MQKLERLTELVLGFGTCLVGPVTPQFGYLAVLVGVDTALGVGANKKCFAWPQFLWKIAGKLAVYLALVVVFHAFDVVAGLPGSARQLAMVAIAGTELVSCVRNVGLLGYPEVTRALEQVLLQLVPGRSTSNYKE